ncbi:MAG: hypothetical protein F6K34_13505 [Okeania sp. SIO4D6]|nr:hypothetical protein [Okeania sp. SIO4D6]
MLKTQEQFINILSIDVLELEDLFTIVNSSALSGNLFVKHLVILADFGGEMLKRISKEFKSLFPDKAEEFTIVNKSSNSNTSMLKILINCSCVFNNNGIILNSASISANSVGQNFDAAFSNSRNVFL